MLTPRSILVFRALDLGDMLCATPALRALRLGFPQAHITLCGAPWAESLVPHLGGLVDTFLSFPGDPALREAYAPAEEREAFWRSVGVQHWDLAVQMHGSGEVTNGIVSRFPAAAYGGFKPSPTTSTAAGGWFVPWRGGEHEVEQLLRLTDALGLPRRGTQLSFHERPADEAEFLALSKAYGVETGRFAAIHPGAKWASRRWPADRFALVAQQLAAELPVVLTGVEAERELAEQVRYLSGGKCLNLAGRTTLGGFGALLRRARLVVTNDTGASHLAAAVGVPGVRISGGSDVARWAPLDHEKHPVMWRDTWCRPCTFESCPYGHECADVPVADVMEALERVSRGTTPLASAP